MMMEKIENFDSLNDFLSQMDDNVSIISSDIPVETQMKYYELLGKNTDKLNKKDTEEQIPMLFSAETDLEEKKKILVALASFDDVKFFRTVEKYNQHPDPELKHWASMAYNHAKVNLENSFLPNKKILISTGLGGKGSKLRYFVVLVSDNPETPFSKTQKKVIKNEIDIVFKENDAEIETLDFHDNYVTLKMLLSLKVPVQSIFLQIISNCNELGRFMSERFIVTNVKELKPTEIQDIIKKENNEEQN